jgi:magnesium transporter
VSIERLIEQRKWNQIKEDLAGYPAPEAAELLLDLEKPDRVLFFRVLSSGLSTEVFAYLETETQNALIKDLADEETRRGAGP